MKILYIYQFFKTPEQGGIIRSYYLSKALLDAGHEVEVLTSHNRRHYEKRTVDGLTVHYLPLAYRQEYGFLRRMLVYALFALRASWLALRLPGVQKCYVASVPLSVGLIGLFMKWLRGIPFVFEVGDLWPLTPIEMGYFSNKVVQKLLYGFEQLIYNQAEKIVGLSPMIQTYIRRRVQQPGKVVCIPNVADCDFFFPTPHKDASLQALYNTEGRRVVTYFGSIGRVVRLDALLDVARQGRHRPDVLFLIVGEGSELPRLMEAVRREQLCNVRFLPAVGKEKIREILNISDAVYLSYLPIPALRSNSPNKLFEALAAGKLCIMNIRGWHCDLLEAARCGFYADPQHPETFYGQLDAYFSSEETIQQVRRRARDLAEKEFSKAVLVRRWLTLFSPEPQPEEHPRLTPPLELLQL